MKWNAADYAAHSVVQQSWARELIAKLKLRGDERVLDVGCGDGKITAEIARVLPDGFVASENFKSEIPHLRRAENFRPKIRRPVRSGFFQRRAALGG
jgi:trans-aconitate methyltransferase